MKWTSQISLANSKIIKSSYIWLLIVPLAARALSSIDKVINLTMFGATLEISTALPFSWQLLFIAACFFTIANVIYNIFCPGMVKIYDNFSEFEAHGKTRMQINSAFKDIIWKNNKFGVKLEYVDELSSYFKHYKDGKERSKIELDRGAQALFDDVANTLGKNSNAFYYVFSVLNRHNTCAIWFSFIGYFLGLGCIAIIAIQNVIYVMGTNF
jgi:hypothetical protein